jgi:hypothetical protein
MLPDFVRGWPRRKRESNQTPGRTSQTRRNTADGSRVTRFGISQIEVAMAQGKLKPVACRDADVSQQSYGMNCYSEKPSTV